MQRNEEVGEDPSYIQGDEDDNGIVTPFAGQEPLQTSTTDPDPRVFTMDREDVLADVV